ncbi:hypothetical protein [Streptomyces sp. NBC_00690]|uniref:hypothetical protein n=1 Tax=Streptomyces sp. NBC_00690 TaxID=2975808 RepID=UPI002E28CCA7|nr:hypothetical protein [Streptomyces sp. NBC_00690]
MTVKYSVNYSKNILGLLKSLMDDAVVKCKLREESPIVEQRRRGRHERNQIRRVKRKLSIQSVHQLADDELREEAEQRYEAMLAMRVQYQMYVADKRRVLAAPKYDSWRTLVMPPSLHGMHVALLATHEKPWTLLSVMGKPLLGTDFDRDYRYPIRDGAESRNSGPRYVRWARPAMPAVSEMAGRGIYRLRHWHKAKLDEPGDIPRVAGWRPEWGMSFRVWKVCTAR